MQNSPLREARDLVVETLRRIRKERGVSQVELARRLGKPQQFVSVVETGDRRIDLVEFLIIVRALGADPMEAFASVAQEMPADLGLGRGGR